MWTALHTIWLPNVVLAASPNWPTSGHLQGIRVAATRDDGLRRLISLCYYPKQSGWDACGQRYTRYGGPMWCLRPAQIGPPQDIPNSLCYYPKQSIIGHYQRFTQMFAELYTIWQSNVELSAIPNGPPQDTYVVVLLFVGEMTVWAGRFPFVPIPNKA